MRNTKTAADLRRHFFIRKNLHIYKIKKQEGTNMVDFSKSNWQQEFDEEQLNQILWGVEDNLTPEQIFLYADPKFNSVQMWEARTGLENGLTMEQVAVYTDPKFNDNQMTQIRLGLENGLTMEQIAVYADPKFDSTMMQEIRLGLEEKRSLEQKTQSSEGKSLSINDRLNALEAGRKLASVTVKEDIEK